MEVDCVELFRGGFVSLDETFVEVWEETLLVAAVEEVCCAVEVG